MMEHINLPAYLLSALRKAKLVDLATIVQLSPAELARMTVLGAEDAEKVINAVSHSILGPSPIISANRMSGDSSSVQNLQRRCLTSGCSTLDKFLRGGIYSQGITEIAGESAAGKTQLCMQLSITAQLPDHMGGLGGGVLYICTEDAFPNRRLMEMVQLLQRRLATQGIDHHPFADNIYLEHTAEIEGLRFCLTKKAPVLLEEKSVKLIIVDSIAALFRGEFGTGEMTQRAKVLSELGCSMRNLSVKHNIPVICVNQVTDVIGDPNSSRSKKPHQMKPALGLSWSHFITSRFMLTRSQQFLVAKNSSSSHEVNIRHMEVLFAPHLPNTICRYIIDKEGVKGLG